MRSSIKPAVLVALMWLVLPSLGSAAEPFYERLLQEGIRANADGDSAQAIQDLTLACFGMLEEPESLTVCRVHLALAQAAQEDREAFAETVGRIIDLEKSFQAYSKAPLGRGLRQAFEQKLIAWIPYSSLVSVKAFSAAARAQQEQELLNMDRDQRRAALTELLAGDPEDLAWKIHMAKIELLDGQPAKALELTDSVLSQDTELLVAICVRGEARAALGRCEEALMDLVSCDESGSRPEILKRRLECRMALEQWEIAKTLFDALPVAERKGRTGRSWDKAIKAGLKEARRRAAEVPSEPAPVESSEPEGGAETP